MERRNEERILVTYPVTLEHGKGFTRNVSGSGVFFECSSKQTGLTPGAVISFSMQLDDSCRGALRVNKVSAQGEVIRVEQRAEKVGVAAVITAYKLVPED